MEPRGVLLVTNSISLPDLIDEIRDHICRTMLIGMTDQSIEPDESLLERGVIDSTGVLELVGFLEERYGIQVADGDITTENLDTLRAIGAYVGRALGASGEAVRDASVRQRD